MTDRQIELYNKMIDIMIPILVIAFIFSIPFLTALLFKFMKVSFEYGWNLL